MYRLVHIIRLLEMPELLAECQHVLLGLGPELRHFALASECSFKELENRLIDWAATQTLADLEKDPDWNVVTPEQRAEIMHKLVRKYETCPMTSQHQQQQPYHPNEQLVEQLQNEIAHLRLENEQRQSNESENVDKLRIKIQQLKDELAVRTEKLERYKKALKDINDVINGKVRMRSLRQHCRSSALDHHYSGTEDKCSKLNRYLTLRRS